MVTGKVFQEFGSAGLGDGTQVGNNLIPGHTYAVIGDNHGFRFFINGDTDTQVAVIFIEGCIFQRFNAQLIGGV